jgi:hypothetical protein
MFSKVVRWAQGRHTLFAIYFTLAGTVLQCFHRLDGNFIALITAVQGFVFFHSMQENKFKISNGGDTEGDKNVASDSNTPGRSR